MPSVLRLKMCILKLNVFVFYLNTCYDEDRGRVKSKSRKGIFPMVSMSLLSVTYFMM